VPEDASSSPSDKAAESSVSVVSIELKGAAGERVRIHLADGSFFVIHSEVFASERLSAGHLLDEARIAGLKSRSECILARQTALQLLSRSAQTRTGLLRKLRSRGFNKDAAVFAAKRMIELGYIDDRAFAENWTQFRISSHREGWKSLYRGLLRNGVPRAIAEEVLHNACTEEIELEKARQLIGGLTPRTAAGRLTSRGFRSRTIARILSEMKQEGRRETEE
jgi:regulatory protein